MTALPTHSAAPTWFAPLDPSLGPSDPPVPSESWREFTPVCLKSAAWELWGVSIHGLLLLLVIADPGGLRAAYFWAYALTALGLLHPSFHGAIPVPQWPREEALLFGIWGAAAYVFFCDRPHWVGQDNSLFVALTAQLLAAGLDFQRARFSLPRQF